jgi:membrane protease YdiL (CAAX protease family)
MRERTQRKMKARVVPAILTFIAIAYGLGIALSLAVGLTGGASSPIAGLRPLAMFVPAAAVIVMRLTFGERLRADWRRFPIAFLPFALFLIPAALHGAMLPEAARQAGTLRLQDWLTPDASGLFHTSPERGWGTVSATTLAIRIALDAVAGLLAASALAFFEEVGWRAWLLPRLAARLDARAAVLLTSFAWALWHVPYALAGIHQVDGASAVRVAISVPLANVGIGLVLGWLWMKTRSIWMVTLAHGAAHSWGQYLFKYLNDFSRADPILVLDAGGRAVLLLGMALVILALPPGKPVVRPADA